MTGKIEQKNRLQGGEPPQSTPRRGRPIGDHEAKRTELLEAALSVLASSGYANASLRNVAKCAGYTTGAVTYYFANKEEMFAAIAEHLFDQYDTLLRPVGETVDLQAVFERWMDWGQADANSWYALFQLVALARHEPTLAEIFRDRYARYRHELAHVLERGQRQGAVRDDISADLLADQLSAMGDGWMLMQPIEPKRFEPTRLKRLIDAGIRLISPLTNMSKKDAQLAGVACKISLVMAAVSNFADSVT
nr:TetR/AcrR family transcriptional regulator [Sphingomonas sp. CDS-1]